MGNLDRIPFIGIGQGDAYEAGYEPGMDRGVGRVRNRLDRGAARQSPLSDDDRQISTRMLILKNLLFWGSCVIMVTAIVFLVRAIF